MALTEIKTSGIADDAVTTDKLANAINTERTANTAKVSTTINNNANNRVITGSGTANTLEGEANLTYDGSGITLTGTNPYIDIVDSNNDSDFSIKNDNGTFEINDATNSDATRLAINSSGRLDVKSGDLAITGAEGGDAQLRLTADEGDDGADYWRLESKASDNTFNLATYASGAWVNKVTVNTDGDVLIGRSSTCDASEVLGLKGPDSEACTLGITSDGTTQAGIIAFNDDDADFRGRIQYSHSDDSMQFRTAATERLKIDSSGALTVSSTTDGAVNISTTDARGPFIRYQVSGTSKVFAGCGEGLGLGSEDDFGIRTDAHLRIRTGAEEHAMITDEGFFAAKGMAGNWVSSQSPASTQAHQFNNTGVSKWVCEFRQEHHAGFGINLVGNSTSNSEAFVIYSNSNNTTRFRVLWDGNCANANNSFGSLSDISIKENIVDAKSQWDDIKAVKVRNFNLKNDPDTKMLGVVAQEIETVSPKLVWKDREGLKGVSYSVLYMKAIKALQEAIAKIETLETKVAALEAA